MDWQTIVVIGMGIGAGWYLWNHFRKQMTTPGCGNSCTACPLYENGDTCHAPAQRIAHTQSTQKSTQVSEK